MSITVDHTRPEVPIRWGNPIGGLTGAMFATLGTLGALRLRSLRGHGQRLDISLLDSQVALLVLPGAPGGDCWQGVPPRAAPRRERLPSLRCLPHR